MPEPGLGAFCPSRGVWGGAWGVYLNSLTEGCLLSFQGVPRGCGKKHAQKVAIAVSKNRNNYKQNLPMAAVILLF